MLLVERQQRVLAILRDRKVAELDELAAELDVSASTIRRDLDALSSKGLVVKKILLYKILFSFDVQPDNFHFANFCIFPHV